MADPKTIELTSAQRRTLRGFRRLVGLTPIDGPVPIDYWGTPRARVRLNALIRRGLVRANGHRLVMLTEAGYYVFDRVAEQDRENGGHDLYGIRRYAIPPFLAQEPSHTYLRTGVDMPCVLCGAATYGDRVDPSPTKRVHHCISNHCGYSFFTEPDAD